MSPFWKEILTLGIPMALRGISKLIERRRARKAAEKEAKEQKIVDDADIREKELAAARSARIQSINDKMNRRNSKW